MGDFKIGESSLNDCKIGTAQVNKIYLGSNLLWTKSTSGFGRLYNGYAVTDSRNIAPTGWHAPSETELNTLISYAGGSSIAGGKLKEVGNVHWSAPNTSATNDYLMSLKGSGGCANTFIQIMQISYIWSATISGSNQIAKYASYNNASIGNLTSFRTSGYSVYLIKDDSSNSGSMIDNDGNTYTSVMIGTQVWAGPIKSTRYRNGDFIDVQSNNGTTWESLTVGACCAYENDTNKI